MSNNKVKSLLKGLRYISQVFENEKEQEIQIGNPTDVKHIAHIGWDGPAANANTAPSWMTEFKSEVGFESGEGGGREDDSSLRCLSECGGDRSRDKPKVPKSTRKTLSEKGSPTKEKSSDKTKRRSSKKGTSTRKSKEVSEQQEEFSSWLNLSTEQQEVPKKSRRKKKTTKDSGGSTRSIRRSDDDNMSEAGGSVRSLPQFDTRDDF